MDRSTQVVNHDLGPTRGQEQRMLATEATACSGDDCNAVFERQLGHSGLLKSDLGEGNTKHYVATGHITKSPGRN